MKSLRFCGAFVVLFATFLVHSWRLTYPALPDTQRGGDTPIYYAFLLPPWCHAGQILNMSRNYLSAIYSWFWKKNSWYFLCIYCASFAGGYGDRGILLWFACDFIVYLLWFYCGFTMIFLWIHRFYCDWALDLVSRPQPSPPLKLWQLKKLRRSMGFCKFTATRTISIAIAQSEGFWEASFSYQTRLSLQFTINREGSFWVRVSGLAYQWQHSVTKVFLQSATNMFCFYGVYKSGFAYVTLSVTYAYTWSKLTKLFFKLNLLLINALWPGQVKNMSLQNVYWFARYQRHLSGHPNLSAECTGCSSFSHLLAIFPPCGLLAL